VPLCVNKSIPAPSFIKEGCSPLDKEGLGEICPQKEVQFQYSLYKKKYFHFKRKYQFLTGISNTILTFFQQKYDFFALFGFLIIISYDYFILFNKTIWKK